MPPFPTLPINPEDAGHRAWLNSIQGNIVKGHGREFTRLLFFRFYQASVKNRWLLPAAVREKLVTTAGDQERQKKEKRWNEPFFSLALGEQFFWRSYFGAAFPPEPRAQHSFQDGMHERMVERHSGGEQFADWDPVYRSRPEGMWLLAHRDRKQLDAMEARVTALLKRHGARPIEAREDGLRWSDDPKGEILREPFGYRDGLSFTDFFRPPEETPAEVRVTLDRLFISDTNHAGGTFLVLRKLDQNVKAFRDFEKTMRDALPVEDAGSLLVGRRRDGTPLVNHAAERLNHFDFSDDTNAGKCPFHAHIRKANPRAGGKSIPDRERLVTAQFVRRSVVYDEGRQLPARSKSDYKEGDTITGGVGLLFMGYMRDIAGQFELMNRSWFRDLDFPQAGTGLSDPIVEGPLGAPGVWEWNGVKVNGLSRFVKSRGGAYFYVPSIAWLKKPRV